METDALFDIQIVDTNAPSYVSQSVLAVLKKKEEKNKNID